MSLVNIIEFNQFGDERGQLIVAEASRSIPFAVKRIYYLTGTKPDSPRGFHAHKKLRQLAVCVAGKCRMLLDNGSEKSEVWLDVPNKAVLIDPLVWHEMHDFSNDCVLLVFADDFFDESDYIRDYEKFEETINA